MWDFLKWDLFLQYKIKRYSEHYTNTGTAARQQSTCVYTRNVRRFTSFVFIVISLCTTEIIPIYFHFDQRDNTNCKTKGDLNVYEWLEYLHLGLFTEDIEDRLVETLRSNIWEVMVYAAVLACCQRVLETPCGHTTRFVPEASHATQCCEGTTTGIQYDESCRCH